MSTTVVVTHLSINGIKHRLLNINWIEAVGFTVSLLDNFQTTDSFLEPWCLV
jgi:hypothetical protein